jgi:GT2 family glycosyltransferase
VAAEFQDVHLVRNAENLGLVKTRHAGVNVARGRLLLFMDSDIEMLPGACEALQAELEEDDRLAFVTCNKRSPDGYPQRSCFAWPTLSQTVLEMIPGLRQRRIEASRRDHAVAAEPGWISPGHSLVRREAWEQVGGQNPEVFFYGEEIEFCHRLRDAGWRIRFIPFMGFIHHGGVSQRGHEDRFRQLSWLGMIRIADLYWPLWQALLLRLLLLLRGLAVCLKKLFTGQSPAALMSFLPRLLWPIPLKEVRL